MHVRSAILKAAYQTSPFPLKGDLVHDDSGPFLEVSCIINFFGRIDLLEGILWSLMEQDLPRSRFEVVLVEDRGGTAQGKAIAERFAHSLNIVYSALTSDYGKMGHSRNVGLAQTSGQYILFLDDDTVILDGTFLSSLIGEFRASGAEAIVPLGKASYCLLRGRYSYHEPFYPTNRCMAYTRDVLRALGGFVSDMVGQEDVELVVRFTAAGKTFRTSERLSYYHPPLIVTSLAKPAAVGYSFFWLRKRYPFLLWLFMMLNGARHMPLLLFPFLPKWRMQGRFGLGFALGTFHALTGRTARYQQ